MMVGVMVQRIINQLQKVIGMYVLLLVLEHGLSGYQHVSSQLTSSASTETSHLVTLYSLVCLTHAMRAAISRYIHMCNYLKYILCFVLCFITIC
jgi:hypothetical protein